MTLSFLSFMLVLITSGINAQIIGFVNSATSTNTNPNPIVVHDNWTPQPGIYLGKGAFSNNNSGNLAIGFNVMNTSPGPGISNLGIGDRALERLVTGQYNIGIGFHALRGAGGLTGTQCNCGNDDIAIGRESMGNSFYPLFSTSFGGNIALGSSSLRNNQSSGNVAIGGSTLSVNTSGSGNVAIGGQALQINTVSGGNVAVGSAAMAHSNPSTTANGVLGNNIAIGATALDNTTGSENIAIGRGALSNNGTISGILNVAIGSNSILSNVSGSNQLSIQNTITGTGMAGQGAAIRIGNGPQPFPTGTPISGTLLAGVLAKLSVGSLNLGNGNASSMPSLQLDWVPARSTPNPAGTYLFRDVAGIICEAPLPPSVGNLTTNCTIANYILMNSSTANTATCSQIYDAGPSSGVGIGTNTGFTYTGGGQPFTQGSALPSTFRLVVNGWISSTGMMAFSDQRLKSDIKKIEGSINKILKISGYTYNWNEKAKSMKKFDDNRQAGFLAQEIEKVLPEAVIINEDGIYGLNYNAIMPLLTEGIKEQQSQLEELKLENENFKLQITELKNKLNQLTPGDVKIKVNSIEVVPNPIKGISTVSYKLDNTSAVSMLIISDLNGRLIKQISLAKNQAAGQVQVSKSDLPKGMYVFSIVSGNTEVQSKKVLVSE